MNYLKQLVAGTMCLLSLTVYGAQDEETVAYLLKEDIFNPPFLFRGGYADSLDQNLDTEAVQLEKLAAFNAIRPITHEEKENHIQKDTDKSSHEMDRKK